MPPNITHFDSPFSVGIPLAKDAGPHCTISVFGNVTLDSFGDHNSAVFDASKSHCIKQADWNSARLTVRGGISAGVQFDRLGLVWFDRVEVLRTTTPEPSQFTDIGWTIEQDLTTLVPFLLAKPRNAYIMVPNGVSEQYNGQLTMSVDVTFTVHKPRHPAKYPGMMELDTTTIGLSGNTSAPSIMGEISKPNMTYTIPFDEVPEGSTILGAEAYVYISGHGCEEFWYGNVDDKTAKQPGAPCGGGSIRALQFLIGNESAFETAGIHTILPVIYTGGLNPYLWHPVTGLGSFNVPPVRIELAPFVPMLNARSMSKVSVRVINEGPKGHWFADVVLQLYTKRSGVRSLKMKYHSQDQYTNTQHSKSYPMTLNGIDGTAWESSLELYWGCITRWTVDYGAGKGVREYSASTSTDLTVNSFVFYSHDFSYNVVNMTSSLSLLPMYFQGDNIYFNRYDDTNIDLNLSSKDKSTADRLILDSDVSLGRRRRIQFSTRQTDLGVKWNNAVNASAVYDRTKSEPREYGPGMRSKATQRMSAKNEWSHKWDLDVNVTQTDGHSNWTQATIPGLQWGPRGSFFATPRLQKVDVDLCGYDLCPAVYRAFAAVMYEGAPN